MKPMIVYCNYTLIEVPVEQVQYFSLPKNDIRYRKALKTVKKHKMVHQVLSIDLETKKPIEDPNKSIVVKRQYRSIVKPTLKQKMVKLYIRDVDVIRNLSEPSEQALKKI